MSGIPDIDYLDKLGYPEYIEEFKRLANDPQIAKELRSNTLPIMSADWSIEPASDSDKDKLIAEFVAANILNQPGANFGREYFQRVSWKCRLRDILRFLQNGFSVFAKSKRFMGPAGRYVIYDQIQYLLPESIREWRFSTNDTFVGVFRCYTNAIGRAVTREWIDGRDLIVYTWDQEGANILGKPLIRPMWKPFRFKTLLEKLQIIDKQKTAVGIPFAKLQADPDDTDETRLEQLAKSMRQGNWERIFAVIKDGQDFGWKEGGTSTKGLPELIAQQDQGIQAAGGNQMTELGQTESGSRGVAGAIGAFESMMRSAIAMTVVEQEQININELVRDNFSEAAPPQLKVSKIDPMETTRNIPAFIEAIAAGAVKGDFDTEQEIRRRYGMGEREEKVKGEVEQTQIQRAFLEIPIMTRDELRGFIGLPPIGGDRGVEIVTIGSETDAPPDDGSDPGGKIGDFDNGSEFPTGDVEAAVQGPALTKLAKVEDPNEDPDIKKAMVDANTIRNNLEIFESRYLRVINTALRDMREAIAENIGSGKLTPKNPRQVQVPGVGDLRAQLLGLLRGVRDFGRRELRAEADRQNVSLGRVSLQINIESRSQAIRFANDQNEVLVDLDITQLAQRLQGQTVAEYNRLVAQGLSREEIADGVREFLTSITDREAKDMARTSTATAFNLGRNVAVEELKEELQPIVIRTEVLDKNTCPPCRKLHGKRVRIGSKDYLRFLPPSFCDGRHRCRGFYLVFPK
jgi:hypothetical protein